MSASDLVSALPLVVETFRRLGIRYYIAGSVASSAHGMPRSTLDVDIVADLAPEHITPLVETLEGKYYIEASALREALRRRTSFNIIHLETLLKVDIFPLKHEAYHSGTMDRARPGSLVGEGRELEVNFSAPEDVILHKLLWYRQGGEVSDRQWADVVGVLRVQGPALDSGYLREWAPRLGIADLLERALGEVGEG